ncbi:MAG: hypothetical protein KAQ64_01550 [Candidatus Pacebacteria bacterium]|nr:hypothetical protein [Candidatus Paceibacterota bacterium]
MSAEQKIIEALELFNGCGEIASNKCEEICMTLGSLLRNDELGKTQIPVTRYIFGRCNECLGNEWGAARAFNKVICSNASEGQKKYARAFNSSFFSGVRRKLKQHKVWSKHRIQF